ncbi:hypothetical protein DL770_010593 [Monosporascus sp. CRB-9-2]|nr:hypothetical protein DL770_010593 [Monosporascus sp. CRB-9-2]
MDGADGHPMLSPTSTLALRIKAQKTLQQSARTPATFYRNLEEALEVRRASSIFYAVVQNDWKTGDVVDFCSNDHGIQTLSTGSGGSRLMDGNYPYIEQVEREIAAFHGAEAGLILSSGFDANLAVWSAIPRPGDVILYDSLVHASTHEGMERSLAMQKIEFQHNNVNSFRSALVLILESQPQIKQGRRSVLVAVESVYSVDDDVCPLQDLVDVAEEMFHDRGNIQFVIDEAHSTGIIGPKGGGLVCQLGLEKDIAVRVHTYGKAMGSSGAIILGNNTLRSVLANLSRTTIFTTAPSFPSVTAIRARYSLLNTSHGEKVSSLKPSHTHSAEIERRHRRKNVSNTWHGTSSKK